MSLSALLAITKAMHEKQKERFGGRTPRSRKIIGYSKGHWRVEYTFSIQGGYSIENHWEQDARSIAHQQQYPLD